MDTQSKILFQGTVLVSIWLLL